jgi:ATP-binding cassette, subfamily G (WHITE), member 2, PDR
MLDYINTAGGILDPSSTNSTDCQYCAINQTNAFLKAINVDFANRWRNFGFLRVYIVFNIAAAMTLYWLARVPRGKKAEKE